MEAAEEGCDVLRAGGRVVCAGSHVTPVDLPAGPTPNPPFHYILVT